MAIPLPLHDLHARLGARFGEAGGHLVPLAYGDPAGEYRAVRQRVGVADRSDRGVIEATGRDRAAFLHGMLTSDVKSLQPGQGRRAAFLDAHGKIVSLMLVHALPDRLLLEMDAPLVEPTRAALDRYLISERVELEDASAAHGVLTVAGPDARAAVEKLAGQPLPDLPPLHHARATIEGLEARVVREEQAGEEGYDLWVAREALASVWARAVAAGAQPVGREAWDVLRIEAGQVRHGVDVDATTLLLEAPLEDAYTLDKGCYLGQEVVARVTYRGHVNRKIVGLRFPDARLPAPGAVVRVAGQDVGRVTSAVVSPGTGRGIGLGMLRREHWAPGTRVDVAVAEGILAAEVTALPFYRRDA